MSSWKKTPGAPSESRVTDIRVVLYGLDTRKVEYCWDLDASNTDGMDIKDFYGSDVAKVDDPDPAPADPNMSRFFMVPKKVVKKDYLMVVIANKDHKVMNATEKGKGIALFEEAMNYNELMDLIGGQDESNRVMNRCLMTNARGYIDVREHDIMPTPREALMYGIPKEAPLDPRRGEKYG